MKIAEKVSTLPDDLGDYLIRGQHETIEALLAMYPKGISRQPATKPRPGITYLDYAQLSVPQGVLRKLPKLPENGIGYYNFPFMNPEIGWVNYALILRIDEKWEFLPIDFDDIYLQSDGANLPTDLEISSILLREGGGHLFIHRLQKAFRASKWACRPDGLGMYFSAIIDLDTLT